MPGKGTRTRNFRIADEVYEPAIARARREGTDLSKVVVEFLREYGSEQAAEEQRDPAS